MSLPFSRGFLSNSSADHIRRRVTNQLLRHAMGEPPLFLQFIYLESPAGYGKTSLIKKLVRDLNEQHPVLKGQVVLLETVLASLSSPADIVGTSFPVSTHVEGAVGRSFMAVEGNEWDGQSGRALPRRHVVRTWTPVQRLLMDAAQQGKYVVWFLDEMNNINAQWEACLLKVCERKLGDRILPPNFILVGAGNPIEQTIQGRSFGESMQRRLYRILFRPDFEEWKEMMLQEVMLQNGGAPFRALMRQSVVTFLDQNSQWFLSDQEARSESIRPAPDQMGYVALNPRNWTLTADTLARVARQSPGELTAEKVLWLTRRRIPGPVASAYRDWFEGMFRAELKHLAADVIRRQLVLVPADVSDDMSAGTTVSEAGTALAAPPSLPVPVSGRSKTGAQKGKGGESRTVETHPLLEALRKKAWQTARQHFRAELAEHERVRTNLLSYMLDSLYEPSSFRPIPYLIGGPGLGKTNFVSRSIDMVNAEVQRRRMVLGALEQPTDGDRQELAKLRDFVMVEVVLPSLPSIADLVGPVVPYTFSEEDAAAALSGEKQIGLGKINVSWRIQAPGDEGLPARHSVTSWTWFTRRVNDLARSGKQVVVFLDELSNISPEWEAVFLKLVEGKLGSWELPGSVLFVAAGNFAQQSTYGRSLKEPAQARLEFMHYHPHFGEWCDYMLRPGKSLEGYRARVMVVEYLCAHPSDFNRGELHAQQRTSPRRWTRAAQWYGRMAQFYGRPLRTEEAVWYLSKVLPAETAQKFVTWMERHGADVAERATHIWEQTQGAKGSRKGRTLAQTRETKELVSEQMQQVSTMLTASRARHEKNQSRLQEKIFTQVQHDITEHLLMDAAIRAYLLDEPSPVGTFSDFIYLDGPPGYGKTSKVKGVIEELNRELAARGEPQFELIEIVLASSTPADVLGVSFPVKLEDAPGADMNAVAEGVRSPGNETLPRRHVVTTFTGLTRLIEKALEKGRQPVIFIDEMSNISAQWEAVLLKVAEGKFGTWTPVAPIRFISAGNAPSESRAGREFGETLNERLVRIPFRPSFLDFVQRVEDGVKAGMDDRTPSLNRCTLFAMRSVVGYLKLYPHQFVPNRDELTVDNRLLCPRNWTMVAEAYGELLYSQMLELNHSHPSDAAATLNRNLLKEYLQPLLPKSAVDGFATFVSLENQITGDDIIRKGQPIPADLSPEQIKVLVRSVCVSLSQHFSASIAGDGGKAAARTPAARARYLEHFGLFLEQLRQQKHLGQEFDSLFMPSLDDLRPVLKWTIGQLNNSDDTKFGVVSDLKISAKASALLTNLFRHIYDALNPPAGGGSGAGKEAPPSPHHPSASGPSLSTPL